MPSLPGTAPARIMARPAVMRLAHGETAGLADDDVRLGDARGHVLLEAEDARLDAGALGHPRTRFASLRRARTRP